MKMQPTPLVDSREAGLEREQEGWRRRGGREGEGGEGEGGGRAGGGE